MSQVEGGDHIVLQRGSESSARRDNDADLKGFTGNLGGGSGWNDGPWWRETRKRDIGAVSGLVEGTKLARASAEAYAAEYFDGRGGVEEAARQATQNLSESNPVRSSDIFLAVQALVFKQEGGSFGGARGGKTAGGEDGGVVGAEEEEKAGDELVAFAVYLHDPIHGLSFHTLSQSLPSKWTTWLDAEGFDGEDGSPQLPEEIREIVESGGVDPREWVSEWVEEVLGGAVGVCAQRYVARRMGVGEGGPGRGKLAVREGSLEVGAGEAARAGMI